MNKIKIVSYNVFRRHHLLLEEIKEIRKEILICSLNIQQEFLHADINRIAKNYDNIFRKERFIQDDYIKYLISITKKKG